MVSSQIDVSVIIPVYNAERTLSDALASIDFGGDLNVEVVAIDDCSTDRSREILAAASNPRLKVIQLAENKGPSAARNVGLENCSGKWVALLDSDDWFSEGRLSKLINIAEQSGLDLIADDQWLWGGVPLKPVRRRSETLAILQQADTCSHIGMKSLLENVGLGITQPIFRRSFLEKHSIRYRTDYRYGEDFRFLYDVISHGAEMGVVNDPLYNVRLHNSSLTANKVEMYSGMIEVLEGIRSAFSAGQYKAERDVLDRSIQRARRTRDYGTVIDPIKRKEYMVAVKNLWSRPWVLLDLIRRSFKKMRRWVRG